MKLFASVLMVLLATTLLSGCGDGPCDAGFSFKYCLDQKSSSSSSGMSVSSAGSSSVSSSQGSAHLYTVSVHINGLSSGKVLTLSMIRQALAVLDFPSAAGQSDGTFGWSFSLSSDEVLTGLGLYNKGNESAGVNVAIWNSAGDLLRNAAFGSSPNELIQLEDYEGFFWVTVQDLPLNSGQVYTLGAFSKNQIVGFEAAPTLAANVQFYGPSLVSFNQSLSQPDFSYAENFPGGYFGPNVRFKSLLTVSDNGYLTFNKYLNKGEVYKVLIQDQPQGVGCIIANGEGVVDNTDIVVDVNCQ